MNQDLATVTPQSAEHGPMKGKNSVGYTLSLIGWLIQIVLGTVASLSSLFFGQLPNTLGTMFGGMMRQNANYHGMVFENYMNPADYGLFFGSWFAIFLLAVVLGGIGVVFLGSQDHNKITVGATLVLVSAIITYPSVWGFGIGSALMIVGAILSLMKVFQFKD